MSEIATRQQNPAAELIHRLRSDQVLEPVRAALPPHITAQRFVQIAVTAVAQNPDLAAADRTSVIRSFIRCAEMGLLPDGREAAIVTFKDNRANIVKAQPMPMIQGIRKTAAEHGWTLRTDVVYDADDFDYELGLDPYLRHRRPKLGVDRGAVVGVYAVAHHRDGRRLFEVMDKAEVEKVRNRSRSKDRGPWADWYDRMAEKSVGHRLFKKLPLDPADKRVAALLVSDDADPVAALYGVRARQELSPAASPPPDETDTLGLPVGVADGSVSGPGETAGDPPPAASLDDEPGPAMPADGFDIVAASETHPPGGKRKDDTLGQIVDEALEGDADARQWLTFALGFDGWKGTAFDATLRAYLRVRLPILLDLAEEGRS